MNEQHILETANWIVVGLGVLLVTLVVSVVFRVARRASGRRMNGNDRLMTLPASSDQQFMMATFQGVIQKQKDQEMELDRLRRIEKERADLSQRINENITRNMPTGLITVDRQGIISGSNPAAKEILRWNLLEAMHCRQVLATAPGFVDMIEKCLETGQRFHRVAIEVELSGPEKKTLGVSVSPIELGKEVSGAVCLISDLTELVSLQEQVRLKQNLAFLGEMSAGIAHEFKNSLAAISGYVQMLRDDELPPQAESSIRMIRRETSQLTETINKFLNFAKPQQIERKVIDLKQVLSDCIHEIQLDPRFRHVKYSYEGTARPYSGDEALLRSAFSNLLLNASESIDPAAISGNVCCRILDLVGDKAHRIVVKINDNGCGVSPEDLEKIFLPFYTSKSSGSGLGLAIVQKIILLHDGRIEIESQPGAGSCVNIYL